MPSLSRELRRLLERTIAGENGARQIAETGAEQSLQRLAVDRHEPHGSLTPEERTLRNQLRAHGRQLGDKLDPVRGGQTINHLKQAVAYEHWHRMLFARFLAENDLLLHPTHGVAMSLGEVKEDALRLGRDWIDLAAEYAQGMLLREVFRSDDPALQVPLSPEKRRDLEEKLNSLPQEIFLADDSLGWVYQFWQKDAKDRVDAELQTGMKADANRIPAKTQLFTEDYMVLFLLENTLGAWWTGRRGVSDLPGYTWTYLRLNEDGAPAAGAYEGWPKSAKELKVLDPCMGSGHFLTFALPILARMRATEEGLSITNAIQAVLRDNLFGLELDPRCSQIAAFNIALTAWKLAGFHFELPSLHLACSGLGINAKEEDWVKLAGNDGRKQNLMRWLYPLFRQAPELGSLIDPRRAAKPIDEAELVAVLPLLERALAIEDSSEEAVELVIAAQGLLAAAQILTDQFTLVATNVPYLARGKQDDPLKDHCEQHHNEAKADLATCFVERSLRACAPGGSVALVTPQNWLFQAFYKDLRPKLLKSTQCDFIAWLGPHAFQEITGEVVKAILVGITNSSPEPSRRFAALDAEGPDSPVGKSRLLIGSPLHHLSQDAQLRNPSSLIAIVEIDGSKLLSNIATFSNGLQTGDYVRFGRYFWELGLVSGIWEWFQSTINKTTEYGGLEQVVLWEQGAGEMVKSEASAIRGRAAWGKSGVAISATGELSACLYSGKFYDDNTVVLTPHEEASLAALWCFCSSSDYPKLVRQVDKALKVRGALVKIPFDWPHWQAIADSKYPDGLPKPTSPQPTQWLFDGHPNGSAHPLLVAVARLIGYSWPRQAGSIFSDCPSLGPDGLQAYAAADGIVCLSSVAGEENASTRLRALLQAAFGADYNMADLLAGKKSATLEDWLRDEFFEEHCQLFHQRPFVWHIWDGLKDGFHALVNYHKLDHNNLEKLIFSYLGDWLRRQQQDVENGVEGADTRLAAAEHLQAELKKILEGEAPYDIFVRWKPLDKQPIGWNPDLNDGVRMNIRPWITEAKLYRATKPGILRVNPNIKYAKDRGKEPKRDPKEFPWFAKSTDRINDLHLSLDEKRRARGLQ